MENLRISDYVFSKSEGQFGYVKSLAGNACHVAFDLDETKKMPVIDLVKVKSYQSSPDVKPAVETEDFEDLKDVFLARVSNFPREISDFDFYANDEDGFVVDIELRKPLLEAKRAHRAFANFINELNKYANMEKLDDEHLRFFVNPRDELTNSWLLSQLDLRILAQINSLYATGPYAAITPEETDRRIADLEEELKNLSTEQFELESVGTKTDDQLRRLGEITDEMTGTQDKINAYKDMIGSSALMLFSEKWSGDISKNWHPKEGLFKSGSAEEIAKEAKAGHGEDAGSAVKALQFYINRNPNSPQAGKVKHAEDILHRQLKDSIQIQSGTMFDDLYGKCHKYISDIEDEGIKITPEILEQAIEDFEIDQDGSGRMYEMLEKDFLDKEEKESKYCSACNGTGEGRYGERTCPFCYGSGLKSNVQSAAVPKERKCGISNEVHIQSKDKTASEPNPAFEGTGVDIGDYVKFDENQFGVIRDMVKDLVTYEGTLDRDDLRIWDGVDERDINFKEVELISPMTTVDNTLYQYILNLKLDKQFEEDLVLALLRGEIHSKSGIDRLIAMSKGQKINIGASQSMKRRS